VARVTGKSNFRAAINWRPQTPFYYGWLVLAMTFLGTFAASGVSQAVIGGIQDFIFEDMSWSRRTIALAATSGTWAAGLVSPFIGRWADRFGPRWLMPVALAIGGGAFFALAGITAVWHFFAAYIVGRALSGQILMGVVSRTTTVNFFRRRRNIVLGLVSSFRPISVAINIMLMSALATRYSWRTAFNYLGVVSVLLILPVLVLMRRRPEDIGLLPDGDQVSVSDSGSRARAAGSLRAEFSWTVREAFGTRTLWFIILTSVLSTTASSTVGFSLKPYLVEVGISQTQAAAVLSLGTVLAIVNIGWGFLAERFTPRRCLVVALVLTAGMNIFLTLVNTLPEAYAFAVLWGLSSRSIGSLEHMMLAQYYGRNSYGSILGTFGPFQTLGLGLGPILGAVLRDIFGNYSTMYLLLVAVYLAAAASIFLAQPPALPSRAGEEALPGAAS